MRQFCWCSTTSRPVSRRSEEGAATGPRTRSGTGCSSFSRTACRRPAPAPSPPAATRSPGTPPPPEPRPRPPPTSRHRLAGIARAGRAVVLSLGPLPLDEAVHLLQQHPVLTRLTEDEEGRCLALRLLEVSRGHPLILSHLAGLGRDRLALADALDLLAAKGLSALPGLFAAAVAPDDRPRARAYLEDVGEQSLHR